MLPFTPYMTTLLRQLLFQRHPYDRVLHIVFVLLLNQLWHRLRNRKGPFHGTGVEFDVLSRPIYGVRPHVIGLSIVYPTTDSTR